MKVPHPIPYQGSKRNIAKYILPFFPLDVEKLIEPFAGSAALSISAAQSGKAYKFILNDINKPLISLLKLIINNPEQISNEYEILWNGQFGNEKEHYKIIRAKFNETHEPKYFLYLLARCVKAAIRYNSSGEFNQSPDNRRNGRHPKEMRHDIFATSHLLKDRTILKNNNYKKVFELAGQKDLIYMDPPYQGVCNNKDPRYIEGITHSKFIEDLNLLNENGLSFLLSYDGYKGEKHYGVKLPSFLELEKVEIKAGRSTQSTLLGGNEYTYESLYISKALKERLTLTIEEITNSFSAQFELSLK